MSVSRLANGRYRAKLKSGRIDVASRVFDTRREAKAWLDRERAAFAGGVDPRAGRERIRPLLARWLAIRRTTVAQKTYRSDQDLERLTPTSLLALQVSAVSGREVARSFESLLASGLSEASVIRYRASLSSFFAWCVREKVILTNPVTGVRVPKQSAESVEMLPFTEAELEEAFGVWSAHSEQLAKSSWCWAGRAFGGPRPGP
jgi:integrase